VCEGVLIILPEDFVIRVASAHDPHALNASGQVSCGTQLHALSGQPNILCRRGVAPPVCNCRGKCGRGPACLSLYLFGLVSLTETEN
jgi:hypothetical protein